MANQLENFDELLKNAYEGTEVPFNESHWKELEDELNIVSPSVTGYFSAISTGIVATSLVFAVMIFMFSDGDGGQNSVLEIEPIVNTTEGEGTQQNSNPSASHQSNQAQIANVENSEAGSDNFGLNENTTESINEASAFEEIESGENHNNQSQVSSASIDFSEKTGTTGIKTNNNPTKENNSNNSDNQTVVATDTEISDEKPNVRKGCTGLTIAFDAVEEYGEKARYLWNFGDGYFSNESNPSHTFNKEGVFDVSLSVTSSASGQITSNVVQAMIEIEEAPIANIDLKISGPNTISFNNKSYNASDVEWNLDDEIYGNGASISLSVADNTNYDLQLSAINEGGCVDTLLTKIRAIKAGSEFPRAMDPSYGTSFAPGAILDEGEVTSVKIYNGRNGDLVFEGSGTKGWNGNLPSGTQATKGNYRWIMAVEQQNSVDVYHGDLELR